MGAIAGIVYVVWEEETGLNFRTVGRIDGSERVGGGWEDESYAENNKYRVQRAGAARRPVFV